MLELKDLDNNNVKRLEVTCRGESGESPRGLGCHCWLRDLLSNELSIVAKFVPVGFVLRSVGSDLRVLRRLKLYSEHKL